MNLIKTDLEYFKRWNACIVLYKYTSFCFSTLLYNNNASWTIESGDSGDDRPIVYLYALF